MTIKMDCPFCDGTGVVHVLVSREIITDPLKDLIYEMDACEKCGGTGETEGHHERGSNG